MDVAQHGSATNVSATHVYVSIWANLIEIHAAGLAATTPPPPSQPCASHLCVGRGSDPRTDSSVEGRFMGR